MLPGDAARCAQIMVETPLWRRYHVTFEQAYERFVEALARGADLFVIVVDGQAAGCVWCVARGAFDRSGYIRLIMVDGAQRSRGLGRELLDYAEGFLGRHADDVFLLVSDFNHDAQRFYQRHGYAQVGALPDYVIAGVAELVYHKRLRPRPDALSAAPGDAGPAHPAARRPTG